MVQSSKRGGGQTKGARLGRYRLLSRLHDAPLGELWAARAEEGMDADKVVLLRRIVRGTSTTEEIADAILDAARSAMGLKHDQVVPVLDVVSTEAEIGVVSLAVEGESLRALLLRAGIKGSGIPASAALRITLDLLEAAEYLHEHVEQGAQVASGLSADNVIVTTAGRARLLEPVLAAYACTVEPWARDPRWLCYRAPETLKSGTRADDRADVFTVGVLLWEMLRNKPLFGGNRLETVERSLAQGTVGRVDSLRPPGGESISKALGDVVARALERDPIARFSCVADFAAAIRETPDVIARPDGVAAFVERVAVETIAQQRELFESPGAETEPRRGGSASQAQAQGSAPDAESSDQGSDPGQHGVPDFRELFGAPKKARRARVPAVASAAATDQPGVLPNAAGDLDGGRGPSEPLELRPNGARAPGGQAYGSEQDDSGRSSRTSAIEGERGLLGAVEEPGLPNAAARGSDEPSASYDRSASGEPSDSDDPRASGEPAPAGAQHSDDSGEPSARAAQTPRPARPREPLSIPKLAAGVAALALVGLLLLWALGQTPKGPTAAGDGSGAPAAGGAASTQGIATPPPSASAAGAAASSAPTAATASASASAADGGSTALLDAGPDGAGPDAVAPVPSADADGAAAADDAPQKGKAKSRHKKKSSGGSSERYMPGGL